MQKSSKVKWRNLDGRSDAPSYHECFINHLDVEIQRSSGRYKRPKCVAVEVEGSGEDGLLIDLEGGPHLIEVVVGLDASFPIQRRVPGENFCRVAGELGAEVHLVEYAVLEFPEGRWDDYVDAVEGRGESPVMMSRDGQMVAAIFWSRGERFVMEAIFNSQGWVDLHRGRLGIDAYRRRYGRPLDRLQLGILETDIQIALKVVIDGWEPALAYSKSARQIDGQGEIRVVVDFLGLARSIERTGPFELLTCSCGVAECMGIRGELAVVHEAGLTLWRFSGVPGRTVYLFDREQARAEIVRGVRALFDRAVKVPEKKLIPGPARLKWLKGVCGWTRRP